MSFDETELSILNELEDLLDMPKTVNESTEMVSLESVAKQVVAENSSPEYLFWKSRVDADLFEWVDDPRPPSGVEKMQWLDNLQNYPDLYDYWLSDRQGMLEIADLPTGTYVSPQAVELVNIKLQSFEKVAVDAAKQRSIDLYGTDDYVGLNRTFSDIELQEMGEINAQPVDDFLQEVEMRNLRSMSFEGGEFQNRITAFEVESPALDVGISAEVGESVGSWLTDMASIGGEVIGASLLGGLALQGLSSFISTVQSWFNNPHFWSPNDYALAGKVQAINAMMDDQYGGPGGYARSQHIWDLLKKEPMYLWWFDNQRYKVDRGGVLISGSWNSRDWGRATGSGDVSWTCTGGN